MERVSDFLTARLMPNDTLSHHQACLVQNERYSKEKLLAVAILSMVLTALIGHKAFAAPEAKLTAGDAAAEDYFGYAVSISGDSVVVGAVGDDDAGTHSGSAYVFMYVGTPHIHRPQAHGQFSITTLKLLSFTWTFVLSPASLPLVSPTKVHFSTGSMPPAGKMSSRWLESIYETVAESSTS